MTASKQRRVTMIICAYGHWGTKNRTPKEIVGYGMYLDDCVKAISYLHHCGWEIEVIPCGGAIEEGMTEAGTIERFLRHNISSSIFALIRPEKKSLTTPANLDQAAQMLDPNDGSRILIVCDGPREMKVKWLRWKIMRRFRAVEVIAFFRPDITPKSTWIFQTLETLSMMLCPPLLRKRVNKIRHD